MTAKRFMVDDTGTLIDMQTRDTFDYVSDVCGLLNELHEQIQAQSIVIQGYQERCDEVFKENEQLQSLNKYLIELLKKNGATVEIEKVKMNDL